MLRKLLKYDLKSGIRIFGFVWLGIALMTGLVCLIFSFATEETPVALVIGILTMLPLVFAIIGAIFFSNIFVALRFYKGLLGQEGYLMFTLPTAPWKLLTSKLISATIFVVGTTLFSAGGLFAIMNSMLAFTGEDIFGILEVFGMDLTLTGATIITLLNFFLSGVAGIMMIYLACCLGHLCRSKRILFSILFYFAIDTVVSFLTSILQIVFLDGMVSASMGVVAEGALYYSIPLNIALSVLAFFFCEKILRTKLNLE